MDVIFLGLLFVLVIPFAEGVLIALLLREVHMRHPLPLGGAIVPEWWKSPAPPAEPTEFAELTESTEGLETPIESDDFDEVAESGSAEVEETGTGWDESPDEVPQPSGISHFDRAANIPKNLPVHNTLEGMTSAVSTGVPLELERLIEEFATAEHTSAIEDDLDQEDLQALADALPGKKIDFSQEIEQDSHISEPLSPSAKEIFGDNFDFHAFEQQLRETPASRQTTTTEHTEPPLSSSGDSATYPAEIALDVQENESGTVQVSSPFMLNVASQFASDFAVPQTVFPTFSNDVLHEPSSTAETMSGDIAPFFFSEESRPMLTKKTKK